MTTQKNEAQPLTDKEKNALAEAMRIYRESAPIKQSEIDMADLIVFANDVQVKKIERFAGKDDILFSCRPGDVIAKPDLIFSKCEE